VSRLVLTIAVVIAPAALGQSAAPRGSTTAADHTFERAGQPQVIAPWARPTRTPKEAPGYIGGGRSFPAFAEENRGPLNGTFGYDYVGYGSPARVFLGWYRSPAAPPGGPYQSDGPRVFDIFSVRPVRRALAEPEGGNGDAGHATVPRKETHK
jgi:hypothetical protein